MLNKNTYHQILSQLSPAGVTLVAVSKLQPVEKIMALYEMGQRDFGENYVQELVDKQSRLPADIRWHFIGHLQSNKVRMIAPFVHLIHGVDSPNLLKEINKQGQKTQRVIEVLLQVHIADEETKFGLDENQLNEIFNGSAAPASHVHIAGLMGMASFSDDLEKVRSEFKKLKSLFDQYSTAQLANTQFQILSMGMSGDYKIAIEEGATMVRIGSLLFGARK